MAPEPCDILSREVNSAPAYDTITVRESPHGSCLVRNQNQLGVLRRGAQHLREHHRFIVGQYRNDAVCVLEQVRDPFFLGRYCDEDRRIGGAKIVEPFYRSQYGPWRVGFNETASTFRPVLTLLQEVHRGNGVRAG